MIRLIDEETDLSKVKPLPWDLVVHGVPYYVAHVDGYVHTVRYHDGGEQAIDLWCWPRNEKPAYENMAEYTLTEPVSWGIEYNENKYFKTKWDESELRCGAGTTITRNGEKFYRVGGGMRYSVPKAILLISEINEHPLGFNEIDFDKKMIGRKIWYNSQPAKIESYVAGQCCIIIVPDCIEKFTTPPEFKNDGFMDDWENEKSLKIDCLASGRVWWFRN